MTGLNVELGEDELATISQLMERAGAKVVSALDAKVIAGGRSNVTLRLSDGDSQWVLRCPPRRGRTPSAHDVAREYQVTSALARTNVPVAAPLLLHKDEGLLGGPFTVAAFVDGQVVQTRSELDAFDDDQVRLISSALVSTLVSLHCVDYESVGLGDFGPPSGYAERQLRRWSQQWQIVGTESERSRRLIRTLADRVPPQSRTSIVHGDFRVDNTILDTGSPAPPSVKALVDWELSTLGDPIADVALTCAYRHEALDLIVGVESAWASPRWPASSALVGEYERVSGTHVRDWEFHLALAYFKLAVIAAGIEHRRAAGAGSGAGFDTAGESVELYLAESALAVEGVV